LGTVQSWERQNRKERWAAAWGYYCGWTQEIVSTDEGAMGGEKESAEEVNVVKAGHRFAAPPVISQWGRWLHRLVRRRGVYCLGV